MSGIVRSVKRKFKKVVRAVKRYWKVALMIVAAYFTAGLALSAFPATAGFAASLPGFAGGGVLGTGIGAGATAGTGLFSKVAAGMGMGSGLAGGAGAGGVATGTAGTAGGLGAGTTVAGGGSTAAFMQAGTANLELAGAAGAAGGAGAAATGAATTATAAKAGLSFADKLLIAKVGTDTLGGLMAPSEKDLIRESRKWHGAFYGVDEKGAGAPQPRELLATTPQQASAAPAAQAGRPVVPTASQPRQDAMNTRRRTLLPEEFFTDEQQEPGLMRTSMRGVRYVA